MHPPPSAISILKEQLGGATTATTGLKHRPRSPPSFDEHTPPKKRSRKDFKGDKGLIVSIEKHKVEGLKRESKPNRKKVFKSSKFCIMDTFEQIYSITLIALSIGVNNKSTTVHYIFT